MSQTLSERFNLVQFDPFVRRPKLKVGTEWVNKGSSCNQAANSVAGIARAVYERTFRIIVS